MSDKLAAISFENSPEINSQLANKIQQLPKSEINKVPDYLQKIPQGTALLYPLILRRQNRNHPLLTQHHPHQPYCQNIAKGTRNSSD